MIEAVIVISTMLIFMGLIVWTRQAYGMKLDMQQQTRSNTFYYASQGCTGGAPSGGAIPTQAGPVDNVAGQANLPGGEAVKRSWNTASGSLTGTANWQATFDQNARGGNGGSISYGKMPLASKVSAATAVTCNEPEYASQATAWFKFGLSMFRSGGDLFR